MFQEQEAIFYYCLTPVHMGAGTAVGGLIDNPIQRERHSGHPVFAGSGLKGAFRHHLCADGWSKDDCKVVFGPESQQASDHAGAASFTDAQLVAFPVRCIKETFVYATSPTALARAKRLLESADLEVPWEAPAVATGKALISDPQLLSGVNNSQLVLEVQAFAGDMDVPLRAIGEWLADNALSNVPGNTFFKKKLMRHLVVLPDEDLAFFSENATAVEPHVRIDDISGTADDGGLFYTENLPPESLMLGLVMSSVERGKGDMSAKKVMGKLADGLDGRQVQIGGDATTGRGQVLVRFVGEREDG